MATKNSNVAKKRKPAVKKAAGRKKPAAATGATGKKAPRAETKSRLMDTAEATARPTPPLIKTLRAEHRHIASVMQLFREQLDAIDAAQAVDTHVAYEIMHYMVTWPDRFHHPREDLIYGRVAELDASAADNVDSLQRDHDTMAKSGREVLRHILQWQEGEVSGAVPVKSGRAYVDHLYQHMDSEESLVFPQIERILDAGEWSELEQDDQLIPIPDPVFGKRVQREFRNMARKLRTSTRRGVEYGTLVEWLSVEAFMESLEVVSMAVESARGTAGEHVRVAWDEGLEMFRDSIVMAPWLCAANNARLGLRLAQEVAEISRDAVGDLSRVNEERKSRIRLLDN
jgi:hemerythrin-like domain-containing protein